MESLVYKNGELVYYKEGIPCHAGVIKVDDAIYYIGKGGKAVKGVYVVHRSMSNGILKHGTYTFGDDYKLVENSYIAPKRIKSSKKSKKDKTKRVAICVVCVLLVVLFAAVVLVGPKKPATVGDASSLDSDAQTVVLPSFDKEVALCSETAVKLYNGEATIENALLDGNPYRPFVFEYSLNGEDGKLAVSENAVMFPKTEYTLAASETELAINNLKTGTVYYYTVTVGTFTKKGTFTTAKSSRFISLPGVLNTRDVGGYTTLDGKSVKQGLIIRGTEIDGLVESSYFLASDYVQRAVEELGFVYDMDLRSSDVFNGDYQSRFGKDVGHSFYNSPSYGGIFDVNNKQLVKNIFTSLATPSNYPMYLHCTYGADRTGTIVFLLQGVLNMSTEDMYTEYRLTNLFLKNAVKPNRLDATIASLETYSGNTLQEKIVDYLVTDIGVTKEEIQSIRDIMLED